MPSGTSKDFGTRALGVLIAFIFTALGTSAQAATTRIVALGDSLTAGYGLPKADAFPAKLQAALKAAGHDVLIENAGVSGDTSTGGKQRLDWALSNTPKIVIVELGANDALRGVDPSLTEKNLDAILTSLAKRGMTVVLAGMQAPRNFGPEYAKEFDAIYPRLAKKHNVLLYPFFLEGVAMKPTLNQADGIHPTAKGVDLIVQSILPTIEKALSRANPS
ncbi:MAG: arylesterase [Myxococcota bacterium]